MKPDVPVTKNTNQHLSNYYPDDFHVVNSGDPSQVTDFATFPAACESRLE